MQEFRSKLTSLDSCATNENDVLLQNVIQSECSETLGTWSSAKQTEKDVMFFQKCTVY